MLHVGETSKIVYGVRHRRVALLEPSAEFLRFAENYFANYYDANPDGPVDASVRHVRHPDLTAELSALLIPKRLDSLQLDADLYVHAVNDVFENETITTFHVIAPSKRSILVVGNGPPRCINLVLMPIIRCFHQYLLLQDGWHPVHAAAATFDGMGILVSGARFSGKTTTLTHLMEALRCDFVTNDKLFVKQEPGGHLKMIALPRRVTVRTGTLASSRVLMRTLVEERPATFYSLESVRQSLLTKDGTAPANGERASLTPGEFARLFGVTTRAEAHVNLCLWPAYVPTLSSAELVQLTESELAKELVDGYADYVQVEEPYWPLMFAENSPRIRAGLLNLAKALAASGAAYRLRQGAPYDTDVANTIRHRLLELRSPLCVR